MYLNVEVLIFLSRHNEDILEMKGVSCEASRANFGLAWLQTGKQGMISQQQKGGMIVFFTEFERKVAEKVLLRRA